MKRSATSSPAPAAVVKSKRKRKSGIGLSLRYKIFGGVLLLVLVVLGAVLAVVQMRATTVTRRAIDSAMKNTGTVFGAYKEDKLGKILGAARQIANDPATIATLTTNDPKTVLDFLESKRKDVLLAEWVMALDVRGVLLARTDDATATGVELGDKSPLFSLPLEGKEASGYSEKGGKLAVVASVPVREGTNLVGALVVAYAVDGASAAEAKELTNADATFFASGPKGMALVSSTLGSDRAESLRAALAAHAGIVQDGLGSGKIVGPVELALGGDPNVVIAVPLASASGQTLGLFVASRSLYQEMATYRAIRDTLVWVGVGAIFLALVVSLLLAAKITQPIRALVEVTEQVMEGNLDVEMPDAPHDEIGLLTQSFSKMLVDLRQKAEMEEYLKSMTMALPGGTMTTAAMGRATGAAGSPGGVTTASGTAVMSAQTASGAPAAATPGANLRPGALFNNRYEIKQILGAGAMGMVYRADDRELDEEVAIKTIKNEALAGDPTAVERFKQEIKLARKITNKHVLRTYDFGEAEGVRFITMEYMKSVTLKYLLEQKKSLPQGPGLHLTKQMCQGLAAAHEQGVIHRDIKPQNMLVNQKGDLKLMDFGISRLADAKGGMTQAGMVIGTPDYMSPEQAQGKPLDARSDIYSTGVVIYEVFCGRLPYEAESALAMVLQHVQAAPLPPRQANPAVTPELERIILKAMEKNPATRYQLITDLYDDIAAIG